MRRIGVGLLGSGSVTSIAVSLVGRVAGATSRSLSGYGIDRALLYPGDSSKHRYCSRLGLAVGKASTRPCGGEGKEVRSAIGRVVLCGRYRLNPIPRRRFWSPRVEQSDLRWVQASMVFSDGRSYTGQSATPMVSRVIASTAFCVASASLTQFR